MFSVSYNCISVHITFRAQNVNRFMRIELKSLPRLTFQSLLVT